MKKKLLTTSLAASLVVGSIAALPVSANVSTANPLPSSASEINATLDAIYSKLSASDKEKISQARDKVAALPTKFFTEEEAETLALVKPIWDIIHAKVGSNFEQYPALNQYHTLIFASLFAIPYQPDYNYVEGLRNETFVRNFLSDLYKLGGVSQGLEDTNDIADITTFLKQLQDEASNQISKSTTLDQILNAKATVKAAVKTVLASSQTKTATALRNIGVTDEAVIATKANFETNVVGNEIDLIFARAYLAVLLDKEPTTGGGVIVTTPSTGEVTGPDTGKAEEALSDVADKLADLLKDKGNGLAKAVEAVQEALRQAATIDVSKSVKVEGQKATLSMDASKLDDLFATVKELAADANEKLKAASKDAKDVKVFATLDLGTVNATDVVVPLNKDVLEKAKASGIDAIVVKANGVSLAIDVDQLGSGTEVAISKKDKSAVPSLGLAVASDVYDFTFTSEGKDVGTFSKPVEVRLPATITGVDAELLVFAKIENGQLIFKGGKYDAEKKEFVVENKSFSTYAVIENSVSFTDTAVVKDWADRQITVAAAKGILEGRTEGEFVPNGKVTRAEFAKMIVKAFGIEDALATETFADVNANDWFQPYVAAAAKAGIINGRSDAEFAPNATITRAEMATMASRALASLKSYQAAATADESLKSFKDAVEIHSTLRDGVALAAEQGVVVGEDGGLFNPSNDATRAQAAVVIYRLLNK